MGEIIIEFSEPPIQRLMQHVFDNYSEFDEFCEFTEDLEPAPVDVEGCVECHHQSYFDEGNPIYECDNFKRVYLVRYLARQFEQSDFVIKEHVLHHIEGKADLSAVSLGGGPAPEALALMNGLSSYEGDHNLFFDNIDCEASWEDIYHDLAHRFVKRVKNIKLKTGFNSSDVTSYVSDKQYDIVFISWLLSEMDEQDSSNVLDAARNLAAPLGHILVIDRDESSLVSRISALIGTAQGLALVEHQSKYIHSIVDFPPDIKATFSPDMGCDCAYWVLQIPPNDF